MRLDYFTVGQVCADVNFSLPNPVVNLKDIIFVETYGLIYLCMFIRHHATQGRSLRVIPPASQAVSSYLRDQNFWQWNRDLDKNQPGPITTPYQTSFNGIVNIASMESIAEHIEWSIYNVLRRNVSFRVNRELVAELATELVDNFCIHSEQPMAVCCLQLYRTKNRLDFAIGDVGIGIRSSLAGNPQYSYLSNRPHAEAALKAMEDGVTRRIEGGTGLGTVYNNIRDLNGQMFLTTGDAWIQLVRGESLFACGVMEYSLPGVQVEVSIPGEK